MSMNHRKPMIALAGAVVVAGLSVHSSSAAVKTWTGLDATNPTYFGDGDNWTPSAAGFNDYNVYPAGSSVKTVQMVFSNGNSLFRSGVNGINFQDAGWLITDTVVGSGGTGGIRYDFNGTVASIGSEPYGINSSGAGINEIASRFEFASANTLEPGSGQPDRPITVNAGNTLLFSGTFVAGSQWTLQGAGTMVVNNSNNNDTNGFNAALRINGTPTLLNRGSMQIAGTSEELDSGTIGGDGVFHAYSAGDLEFDGTTLSPGGDGTAVGGPEIGSLTFESGSDTNRTELSLRAGTTVAIQIGLGGVGDNDKLLFDGNSTDGINGKIDIEPGVTLALSGGAIADGTYTIISDIGNSGAFTGTFDTVLWNGSPINPSEFVVNYGDDSIDVVVTLVPEPASLGLIGLIGVGLLSRRRSRA